MKVKEIENIKELINEIVEHTKCLDYNTSSYINKRVVQIVPILDSEIDRLSKTELELDCPQILIFSSQEARDNKKTLQDYMNLKLKELCINGYKIVDYGKFDEQYDEANRRIVYMYIKYTS